MIEHTRHYLHCRDRAKERYGLTITWDDWTDLNERIYFEDDVKFVYQPNPLNSIYQLRYRNQTIVVLFCETVRIVTTILPVHDCRVAGVHPSGRKTEKKSSSSWRRLRLAEAKASPRYGNRNLIDENTSA